MVLPIAYVYAAYVVANLLLFMNRKRAATGPPALAGVHDRLSWGSCRRIDGMRGTAAST